jgi:hypothetical protein
LFTITVNRPGGVDYVLGGEGKPRSDYSLAGLNWRFSVAGGRKPFRSGGGENRAANPAAIPQCRVGGVYDGVNIKFGDVVTDNSERQNGSLPAFLLP